MSKVRNERAWFLVLPVVLLVAFSAVVPLMTVVNYSIQDIWGPDDRVFVGADWFRQVLTDGDIHAAFYRQFLFSAIILAIEIPLGVGIALIMPQRGWRSSLFIVAIALPLLIPFNVVGTMWQVFARPEIGLFGRAVNALGIPFNYTSGPVAAWVTVVVMDVWHWTPLVALLAFAGLRSIPGAYYQAARIDAASRLAIFRFIELPKLRGVLTIAILLRLMDSLMIYTEPFVVTGGGPGSATTFLSIHLVKMAVGQFDLGPAASFSIVYFLMILLLSFVFYTALQQKAER
jgi:glycerol transport system permease protein